MKQFVYINGKLVTKNKAQIPVFDHGLLYGDGIFETMRSYMGKVFQIDDHLSRLYKNATAIQLKIPKTKSGLKRDIYHCIEKNKLVNAYIKVAVTRGTGEAGLNIDTCKRPNIIIITKQAEGYPPHFYTNGMTVKIVKIRQNNYSPLPAIKSFNYLNNILAKIEAKKNGFMDAILLNVDGFVTEATASNLFIIKKDNIILTPSVRSGILSGITRKVLIKIIKEKGLELKEKDNIKPHELLTAKEVFLTNSIGEVLPVVKINDKIIGSARVGNITKKLHDEYKRLTLK